MFPMIERLEILWHFCIARWGKRFSSRETLMKWQRRKVDAFLRDLVNHCSFYQNHRPRLEELPVMDKPTYRANFQALNRLNISLEDAEAAALKAEKDRDFSNELPGGVTVGLSSGTSGRRGVFLTESRERRRWAGIVLAHSLSPDSLKQLLNPLRPPLKIAFCLRADSNLYRTIAGSRIRFQYFDLLANQDELLNLLQSYQPDVLIAPATILARFAKTEQLTIRPRQVISVAEVLDQRDASLIEKKFNVAPTQIYQATEGYLARTCRAGKLHLNEEYLQVEREWADEEKSRFHPIITDFTRQSQSIIRYRLDDILVPDHQPCECGSPTSVISKIEGRADQVLWFPKPVFPETLRQALYTMPQLPDEYRIEQHGEELHVYLAPLSHELVAGVFRAITDLFTRLHIPPPALRFQPWIEPARGDKLLRIRCISRP